MAVAASRLTATITDTVSGVTIGFNAGVDDYGIDWRMGTFEGWDSPDLPEASEERPSQDGLWDADNNFGGRTLTIAGVFTASTYEAREAAEYRLRQAVPRDRLATVTVAETTPKTVAARRTGRLMVRPLTDVTSEYSIAMLAPDPRKYATTPTTATIAVAPSTGGGLAPPWTPPVLLPATSTGPSQTSVVNAGIYNSPPILTIRGPGYLPTIYNVTTGTRLAYDLTLAATDYITVDVGAGVSLLNGSGIRAPAPGSTITAAFLIEPGANLLRISATLTDAVLVPSADIVFYSSWT